MKFKTVQSSAIKTLIEGLKDIIIDVNLKVNETGVHVTAVDGKLVTMINLNLNAESFESFECAAPITLGVNIKDLFVFLKPVGNNDVITMFVDQKDTTKLGIVVENNDKNMRVSSSIRLLDLNDCEYQIPDMDFDSVIKLPSSDFQKYCKDLSNISDTVIIKNKNNEFTMSVECDAGSTEIVLGENVNVEFNKNTDNDYCDRFDIKYLLLFIKNSNLCSNVELYLNSDLPLIIVYSVASLGSLKFVLAPKVEEEV